MNAPATTEEAGEFILPTEPYPGLRPFLSNESMLFFGRDHQIAEIVAHLQQSKFVAVLGGSGSGKSSLINAGVAPCLRSFGISKAGDFWITMACTPGTPTGTCAETGSTPITRFARKFARLLKSRGSSEKDALRERDIASCLRHEAGFALLIEAYIDELVTPPGPRARDAQLLFVIDQFEELFHPSNKDCADASLLVERVIDHFYSNNQQCYVVLTMRSEHLSDCARYLELPDAINKASYLVRRLSDDELRKVIVGPVTEFVDLLGYQTCAGLGHALQIPSAAVDFHEDVIDRLLHDTKSIASDPDHLPLLQHLLARVWQSACIRENVPRGGAPGSIIWADLQRAAFPGSGAGQDAHAPSVNLLRASVDNWAEAIFTRRDAPQQKALEHVVRRLAFKDPTTGHYSQQRLDVDQSLLGDEGGAKARDALWESVTSPDRERTGELGFIGSVDYLFWDNEDPSRITLKVSHESFIRGWVRMRKLIDKDADRQELYLDLLRKCARWADGGTPERLLLESADLERVRDDGIDDLLADADEHRAWLRILQLDRDGERLVPYDRKMGEFLGQSRRRQEEAIARHEELYRREREALAAKKKISQLFAGACVIVVTLLPFFLLSKFIHSPVMQSVDDFANARSLVEPDPDAGSAPGNMDSQRRLTAMLKAVNNVESAKEHGRISSGMFSRVLLELNGFTSALDANALVVKSSSEPVVNRELRRLLTSTVWRTQLSSADTARREAVHPGTLHRKCSIVVPSGGTQAPQGALLRRSDTSYGIFIPAGDEGPALNIYMAKLDAGQCSAPQIIMTVPRFINPGIVFDAGLRYMAMATDGRSEDEGSVSTHEIQWTVGQDVRDAQPGLKPGVVVSNPEGAQQIRKAIASAQSAELPLRMHVLALPTWPEPGGFGVAMADTTWRFFTPGAERLTPQPRESWQRLNPLGPNSRCVQLHELLKNELPKKGQGNDELSMFESDRYCFQIVRSANPASAVPRQPREVVLAVYDKRTADTLTSPAQPLPASVASIRFGRYPNDSGLWLIGKEGPYAGWVALQREATNGALILDAAPWSTVALRELGKKVQLPTTAAAVPAAPTSDKLAVALPQVPAPTSATSK
jgi:hypothetical protein